MGPVTSRSPSSRANNAARRKSVVARVLLETAVHHPTRVVATDTRLKELAMQSKNILVVSAVASTLFLAAAPARAADEPVFGKAGQLSLGSDLNLAATGSLITLAGGLFSGGGSSLLTPASMLSIGGSTTSNNGGSQFGISLAPAADYFVIDNLSLGLEILFGYGTFSPPSTSINASPAINGSPGPSPQSTNLTEYGFAPRIGYNIPISNSVSVWPKVFFEHAGYSLGGAGAGYGNVQLLGAYVPILFHPAPHFYVGLGPNILTELGASSDGAGATSKVTSYGVFASVGGWFNLGG
jgi:hypothetical protein